MQICYCTSGISESVLQCIIICLDISVGKTLTTNFRLFQTEKKLADDNFRLDKNIIKFSKLEENTVGKGEIAYYEQFLLFPQCFQKTCIADT